MLCALKSWFSKVTTILRSTQWAARTPRDVTQPAASSSQWRRNCENRKTILQGLDLASRCWLRVTVYDWMSASRSSSAASSTQTVSTCSTTRSCGARHSGTSRHRSTWWATFSNRSYRPDDSVSRSRRRTDCTRSGLAFQVRREQDKTSSLSYCWDDSQSRPKLFIPTPIPGLTDRCTNFNQKLKICPKHTEIIC